MWRTLLLQSLKGSLLPFRVSFVREMNLFKYFVRAMGQKAFKKQVLNIRYRYFLFMEHTHMMGVRCRAEKENDADRKLLASSGSHCTKWADEQHRQAGFESRLVPDLPLPFIPTLIGFRAFDLVSSRVWWEPATNTWRMKIFSASFFLSSITRRVQSGKSENRDGWDSHKEGWMVPIFWESFRRFCLLGQNYRGYIIFRTTT